MEAEKEIKVFNRNTPASETRITLRVFPTENNDSTYVVEGNATVSGGTDIFVSGPYTTSDNTDLSWALDKVSADLKAILTDKL